MTTELKPCPNCRKSMFVMEAGYKKFLVLHIQEACHRNPTPSWPTEEKAIQEWNKREENEKHSTGF